MSTPTNVSTEATETPNLIPPILVDCDIIDSSPIQPRTHFEGIEDLAASILSQGLINPIVVRRDPKHPLRFELIAGERRLRACKLIPWSQVPAVVRDLCDNDAHDITAMENLEREDLTAIEESRSIRVLLDTGGTIAEVADRLGRARGWVARRAMIDHGLVDSWKKELATEGSIWTSWSASMLEQIARLNSKDQRDILASPWIVRDSLTVADLRKSIQNRYMHDLTNAPFPVEREDLLTKVRDCEQCQHRTGAQPELFDDLAKPDAGKLGRCLDGDCWAKKSQAAQGELFAAAIEQYGKGLRTMSDGMHHGQKPPWGSDAEKRRLDRYNLTGCKKSDPKALPVFVLAGKGENRIQWMKKGNTYGGASNQIKTLKQLKAAHEEKRARKVCSVIAVQLRTQEPEGRLLAVDVLRLVAVFGADSLDNRYSLYGSLSKQWKLMDTLAPTDSAGVDEILLKVRSSVLERLAQWVESWNGQNNPKDLAQLCERMGIDYKAIRAEVLEANPAPKKWEKLNADGTLKPEPEAAPKPKKKAAKPVARKVLPPAKKRKARKAKPSTIPGTCRVCGCTYDTPCVDEHGDPCAWTDKTMTLCTACEGKEKAAAKAPPKMKRKSEASNA